MSIELKMFLLSRYESFADKRLKNVARGNGFIIDSRSDGGEGSTRSHLYTFCSMYLDVISNRSVGIRLSGNVPQSKSVAQLADKLDAESVPNSLSITVTPESLSTFRNFANSIAAIAAPGKRYSVPSYKYVCPLTARYLIRVAQYLEEFWGQKTGETGGN